MQYHQLQQDEMDALLADALYAREREHFEYDVQVQHQESLLAEMPTDEWPKAIAYLKGMSRDEMIRAAQTPEDLALAHTYDERDRISVMSKAAKIERSRVERYHAKTLDLLPANRRTAAFSAAANKRGAEQAARVAGGGKV